MTEQPDVVEDTIGNGNQEKIICFEKRPHSKAAFLF